MARHRSHSVEFKRQVAQEFIAGETLHGLAKRRDVSRNLIRFGRRSLRLGRSMRMPADLLQEYEAKIAALERMVGRQALEIEFLKGAVRNALRPRSVTTSVITGPDRICVAEGCRLMGLPRSTYYDAPAVKADDAKIVAA